MIVNEIKTKNYYKIGDHVVWVSIPKNASTTIKRGLIDNGYDSLVPYSIDELNLTDKFIFACTRNPYDRLVSAWQNRIVEFKKFSNPQCLNTTFPEFVRLVANIPDEDADQHIKSQYFYLKDIPENKDLGSPFIFDIEDIREAWIQVIKWTGTDYRLLKHKKKSNKGAWENYYNQELKNIVYERYKNDFLFLNISK